MTLRTDRYADGKADARREGRAGETSTTARERAQTRHDHGRHADADYWTGYAVERARMEREWSDE